MSDRLAISSAFSVFMMACYVLLGGDAAQVRLQQSDRSDAADVCPGHLAASFGAAAALTRPAAHEVVIEPGQPQDFAIITAALGAQRLH